jgi:DNA processing protein
MPARAFNTPISTGERFMQITVAEALGTLTDVEEKNAPKTLYFQGNRELLNHGPRVSVVGSRKASEEGLKRARSLARALVAHDIVVVSGLAEGIDAAAHTSALEAGGKTFAVIGTPLDTYYPKENQALQQRLELEQLVISQFPIGSAVTPKNFPIRNRTMALLTDATVIVEAGEKSGTVHQGWEALRLGRQLFLLESVASDKTLTWPEKMIHYGAHVLSRENLDDVLSDIPAVTRRHDKGLADYV